MEISTGRPPTLAPRGLVSSPHAVASAAGVDVLRAGGSAVDAAIATSAALSVLYPHMASLGGDAFWLIYDTEANQVHALDGGGRAVAGASPVWFKRRGMEEIPYRGILPATVTVPGAVASWCEAHARYGRLTLERNLRSATTYAREGIPVTARLSHWIRSSHTALTEHPESAAIFLPDGGIPRQGSMLTNSNLARTLEAVAEHGWSGFYEGETAAELVRFSRAQAGFFTAADLAAQHAVWGTSIAGTYHGITIHQTPPPSQGFTLLEMLNLVEPFDLSQGEHLGPDEVHLLVQAKQVAFHDRDRWLADPRFVRVPLDRLLSRDYADDRRSMLDMAKALPWDRVPSYGSLAGDTVYVAVVDGEGNAVSLIHSLYWGFGSAVVAGQTGVVLQNRGAYFSLDSDHPNALVPGKTPLHTLMASLAFRDHKLWSVLGCMGADGQPQIQLQVYVAMIDHGHDIQEAIEAPRWLSGRFVLGEARDTLHMEGRFPETTFRELERRGHAVDRWGSWNELAGHTHGIVIDPDSSVRIGGSDPRSDGAAIGY